MVGTGSSPTTLELGAGVNGGVGFLQSPAEGAMADDGRSGGGKGEWEE